MKKRYSVLLISILFLVFVVISGCSKTSDCKKKLNGKWTGTAMGFNVTSVYNFDKGKTYFTAMGETSTKNLKMVKCTNEMAVFMSGETEITAIFKDDNHIQISKEGGLAVEMTKVSDFTKPPKSKLKN